MAHRLVLSGLDTVECAYYLGAEGSCELDFESLAQQKESLRQSKARHPKVIVLGEQEFLQQPYGSSSGYPFVMTCPEATISFGEFNNPSFFVKYSSLALWHHGLPALHERFLAWAASVGLWPFKPESLSRVDFSFDYQLSAVDFDEDDVVSLSSKATRYRKDRRTQTIQYGKGDIVLRIYDKVAEIEESSGNHWLLDLWARELTSGGRRRLHAS